MIAERFPEVMALPDDEKFRFIAELWDEVTGGEVLDYPAITALIEVFSALSLGFWILR